MRVISAVLVASYLFAVHGFPAVAQNDISGHYNVSTIWGDATGYSALQLEQKGDKLTGTYRGNSLEGTRHGDAIDFTSKDKEGNSDTVHLMAKGNVLIGTDTHSDVSGHIKQSPALTVTATEFRRPPPKGLWRDLLLRTLAWRIQEKAFGGHDKATLKLLKASGQKRAGDQLRRRQCHRACTSSPASLVLVEPVRTRGFPLLRHYTNMATSPRPSCGSRGLPDGNGRFAGMLPTNIFLTMAEWRGIIRRLYFQPDDPQ